MKGLESGKDKVKKICDALRRETLEPAERQAADIIEKAQREADEILADAHTQAKKMVDDDFSSVFNSSLSANDRLTQRKNRKEIV